MAIDNKYFQYCKELGLMKETYTKEFAVKELIKHVTERSNVDPQFVSEMQTLTASSQGVVMRAAVLYRYDINLNYIQYGHSKSGRIADFGQSGVHKDLKITEYKGDGSFTRITSAAQVPYAIWNDKNLFTYEQMKGALKDVINKQIPQGTTEYSSTDWSISAYFVPVLVIFKNFGGKEYKMYFNLQNGCWHIEWPEDPTVKANAKKEKKFMGLYKAACILLSFIAMIVGANSGVTASILLTVALLIAQIVITVKNKPSSYEFEKKYLKNRTRKPAVGALLRVIPMLVIVVLGFILGTAIA